jgi:hypothetical protein
MNNHITQIDKFSPDIIDHDIVVPNKTYFNIYNNSLDEPFHKFWFFIENAKLINIYNENSVFRFALNTKSDKNKKLIEYLKNLFEYVKKLFICTYPDIIIENPWKEYDNYPCLINFIANSNTICLDSKENSKNITEINKDQTYSIFFELTYIQVAKLVVGDKPNYSLKFKFNLIMIQEKLFDKKFALLENINQMNNPKTKYLSIPSTHSNNNSNNNLYDVPPTALMSNVLGELTQGANKLLKNVSLPAPRPIMRFSLDANELVNKKNALNKIGVKEVKEEVENGKNIPEYLEQKNKLKKVETDERTLLTILKREYNENLQVNNDLRDLMEVEKNKTAQSENVDLSNIKKSISDTNIMDSNDNKKSTEQTLLKSNLNSNSNSNPDSNFDSNSESNSEPNSEPNSESESEKDSVPLKKTNVPKKSTNTTNSTKLKKTVNSSKSIKTTKSNKQDELDQVDKKLQKLTPGNSTTKSKIIKKPEKKNNFDLELDEDLELELEFEKISKN